MRALLITVLAAALAGCGITQGDPEPIISGDLAGRVARAALMTGTLAAEIGLSTAEPSGPGGCPSTSSNGDQLVLDYGVGCVPESEITLDAIGGNVDLIVAGGMGTFVGDVQALGFADLPLVGSLSGDTSRAGDLLAADIDLESIGWTADGVDNTLNILFEIEANTDGFLLNAGPATFLRGQPPEVFFHVEDVTVPRDGMGACFVPDGGVIRMERLAATAIITFSEEAASSGSISVVFNDREEPETFALCP
ncbi:MAG: hypothetical protein GY898_09880 [Proteobacteria bacterium]|nr:hypothetical protein [Pseudomonadota bacterium]